MHGFRNVSELVNLSFMCDLICLSETWLLSGPTDYPLMLSSYNTVFSNAIRERSLGRGSGGIAIFIHKKYNFEVIESTPWWIFCLIKGVEYNFVIGNVYFKPSLNIVDMLDLLQMTLLNIIMMYPNLLRVTLIRELEATLFHAKTFFKTPICSQIPLVMMLY